MKSILLSKTFWVNLIAIVGLGYQAVTGKILPISIEQQAMALSVINIILRTITKSEVKWL